MNDANRRGVGRNTYFFVDFYKIYIANIHSIIKILCDDNGINWLRNPMSYNRFPNLGRHIQGNFTSRL